jgi:hypothetical protein
VQRVLDVILRRPTSEPDIPVCPDHKVEMRLRGKQGRPARFSYQSEEEYTFIYFCPVHDCDHSKSVKRPKSQSPVASEIPARPSYSRQD